MIICDDKAIEQAKSDLLQVKTKVRGYMANHGPHSNCVRIAYQWLSIQYRAHSAKQDANELKQLIRGWAGYYIKKDDVLLAAHLLGFGIAGNAVLISKVLTRPALSRLSKFDGALTHQYGEDFKIYPYGKIELDMNAHLDSPERITLVLHRNQQVYTK